MIKSFFVFVFLIRKEGMDRMTHSGRDEKEGA